MYSAVLNNQTDFVELFMENGSNLREFLTKRHLLMLYNNVRKMDLPHWGRGIDTILQTTVPNVFSLMKMYEFR